jgi:hypothetical protein
MIDPLIAQARIVVEYQRQERALAVRRSLRPQRSQAAHKGHETRKGNHA